VTQPGERKQHTERKEGSTTIPIPQKTQRRRAEFHLAGTQTEMSTEPQGKKCVICGFNEKKKRTIQFEMNNRESGTRKGGKANILCHREEQAGSVTSKSIGIRKQLRVAVNPNGRVST